MAVKAFDSYEEAVKKMVVFGDGFTPDMDNHQFYDTVNQKVYQTVHQHFDPVPKKIGQAGGLNDLSGGKTWTKT